MGGGPSPLAWSVRKQPHSSGGAWTAPHIRLTAEPKAAASASPDTQLPPAPLACARS
jgi:hypothetical protein